LQFQTFLVVRCPGGKQDFIFAARKLHPGTLIKGKCFWPAMLGQTDSSKLLEIVKTDNPQEEILTYLNVPAKDFATLKVVW